MNIDCPHCDTTNKVEFAENIHCHSQRASINRTTQAQLIKKCSCALDKTIPEVNQKHLNIKSMKFSESFAKNLNSCK